MAGWRSMPASCVQAQSASAIACGSTLAFPNAPESTAFVNRDVIRLQALDQVLRIGFRGVMRVPLDPSVRSHFLDDRASHTAGLRVPFDSVASLESDARMVVSLTARSYWTCHRDSMVLLQWTGQSAPWLRARV